MSNVIPYDIQQVTNEIVQAILVERVQNEVEKKKLQRMVSDCSYMLIAFKNMLGPKGLEVAALWEAKKVNRVHFDWTAEALQSMTGEERADEILKMESAMNKAGSVEL